MARPKGNFLTRLGRSDIKNVLQPVHGVFILGHIFVRRRRRGIVRRGAFVTNHWRIAVISTESMRVVLVGLHHLYKKRCEVLGYLWLSKGLGHLRVHRVGIVSTGEDGRCHGVFISSFLMDAHRARIFENSIFGTRWVAMVVAQRGTAMLVTPGNEWDGISRPKFLSRILIVGTNLLESITSFVSGRHDLIASLLLGPDPLPTRCHESRKLNVTRTRTSLADYLILDLLTFITKEKVIGRTRA